MPPVATVAAGSAPKLRWSTAAGRAVRRRASVRSSAQTSRIDRAPFALASSNASARREEMEEEEEEEGEEDGSHGRVAWKAPAPLPAASSWLPSLSIL